MRKNQTPDNDEIDAACEELDKAVTVGGSLCIIGDCEIRGCRDPAVHLTSVTLRAESGGGDVMVRLCARHYTDLKTARMPNGTRLVGGEQLLTRPILLGERGASP